MVRELKVSVRVDDESMRGIEEAMRASGEGSVSEFVRKSLRLAVLAHASDRRALLDVSPYLVGMIDRYLESGHARRRSLRTYEDLIVYALVNFFQQAARYGDEAVFGENTIWQLDEKLFSVGEVDMPRGVDTWSEVVQSLCEQSLRSGGKAGGIRVTEWRVPEEEELHKKNYWVYMRACYRGYCFFVGGMNDFSGSGREAYDTALRTLRNVGVQPEVRMGDDEELRFIMQKIYALDVIDRAAKIRIARSVKEILRMVSEKTA